MHSASSSTWVSVFRVFLDYKNDWITNTIRESVRTNGFSVAQLTERRREKSNWHRVAEGDRMVTVSECEENRENNWNGYNRSDFDCSLVLYKSTSSLSTEVSVILLIIDITRAEDQIGVSLTDFGVVRVGLVEMGIPEQIKRRSRRKYDE